MLNILMESDPRMSQTCEPVADFPLLQKEGTVEEIIRVMRRTPRAYALAANQVGVMQRIIVHRPKAKTWNIYINPEIIKHGKKQVLSTEECMSLPGKEVTVKRWASVKVRYQDTSGESKTIKADHLVGRMFQHEIDHLNGIRLSDNAVKIKELKR